MLDDSLTELANKPVNKEGVVGGVKMDVGEELGDVNDGNGVLDNEMLPVPCEKREAMLITVIAVETNVLVLH